MYNTDGIYADQAPASYNLSHSQDALKAITYTLMLNPDIGLFSLLEFKRLTA